MHVKTEDEVLILAGKDKGRVGEVLEADPDKGRVKVERMNMIVKHRQPNEFTGEEGARIERENWIDASNVALFIEEDDEDGEFNRRPVRVGYRYVGADGELFTEKTAARDSFDGDGPEVIEKVRIARQTGDVLDPMPSY
jgi:large subunit ribosomal protein L24